MPSNNTPSDPLRQPSKEYLIPGDEYLASRPDFRLVERDEELTMISNILMRRDANSLILTGPSGAGTTALIMGLEACKDDPDTPYDISGKKFYWLDTDGLFSSGDVQVVQDNFQKVLSILSQDSDSVLVIQNAPEFIEAARNRNCPNLINALMRDLWNKKFQAVFECRDNQLPEILACHPYIRQVFTVREIAEPGAPTLRLIVREAAKKLERFHDIRISPEAIDAAIRLTEQFHIPQIDRAQPGRTLALLDFALTSYRHAAHAPASGGALREAFQSGAQDNRQELHRQIRQVRAEQAAAEKALRDLGEDGGPARRETLEKEIGEKKSRYRELERKINEQLVLTADHVRAEFSRLTRIPVSSLDGDEYARLLELDGYLAAGVFGQDETVKSVTNAVRSGKLGLKSPDEPVASLIFLGPSGTGKTALAERLAHHLFQDKEAIQVYDMSEYSGEDGVRKFTDTLVQNMRRRPYCVNVFDEVEKGNRKIPDLFLQINDKGRLTDSSGLVAEFANAINIVTSNIGQDYFYDEDLSFEKAAEKAREELANTEKSGFRNEVLSRFTGIYCFRPLEEQQLLMVARRQFEALETRLKEKGMDLIMPSDEDMAALCKDHYVRRKGARSIQKYLRENISSDISLMLLKNPGMRGTIRATYDRQEKKVLASFEPTPAPKKAGPQP